MKSLLISFILLISFGCNQNKVEKEKAINRAYEVIYSYETSKGKKAVIKQFRYQVSGNEKLATDSKKKLILKNFKNSKPTEIQVNETFSTNIDGLEHELKAYTRKSEKDIDLTERELVSFYKNEKSGTINFFLEIKQN